MKQPRARVRQVMLRFYPDNPYHAIVIKFLDSLSRDGRGTRNVQAILEPAIIDQAKAMMRSGLDFTVSREHEPGMESPPQQPDSATGALFPREDGSPRPSTSDLLQKVASQIRFE